jgi:hypothetical protein
MENPSAKFEAGDYIEIAKLSQICAKNRAIDGTETAFVFGI